MVEGIDIDPVESHRGDARQMPDPVAHRADERGKQVVDARSRYPNSRRKCSDHSLGPVRHRDRWPALRFFSHLTSVRCPPIGATDWYRPSLGPLLLNIVTSAPD